jgi:heterodisulfide reductase subunit C
LFALLAAGFGEDVLSSNTPWHCVSCYYCTVRCPQDIPITDIMYTLKRKAIARGKYHKDSHADFSNSFIGYVEQYGRSFEFGLATRHHLTHRPLSALRQTGMGFEMMQKGRLKTSPGRIKNLAQLTAILDEATRIQKQEEA